MKLNFKYILIILIICLFFIRKKNMEGLEDEDEDIKYLQVLGGGLVGLLIGLSIGFAYHFFSNRSSDTTSSSDPTPTE